MKTTTTTTRTTLAASWLCLQATLCVLSAPATNATVCAPLSRFKIDCNTCYCSVDGRRYTCSKRFCTSDVALNYDFLSDAPQPNEHVRFDDDTTADDWTRFLNDLAVADDDDDVENNERRTWRLGEDEFDANQLDYGDFLNEKPNYMLSKRRFRF